MKPEKNGTASYTGAETSAANTERSKRSLCSKPPTCTASLTRERGCEMRGEKKRRKGNIQRRDRGTRAQASGTSLAGWNNSEGEVRSDRPKGEKHRRMLEKRGAPEERRNWGMTSHQKSLAAEGLPASGVRNGMRTCIHEENEGN